MRIAMIAPGSRGDVEPYLALGQGLTRAGHHARVLSHSDFEPLVQAHGVEFWPLGGSVRDVLQGGDLRQMIEGGNFFKILSQMAKEAQRGAVDLARDGLAGCRGMDLLVAGLGGIFGMALAEKLDVPLLQAYYIPFTPTGAYPSFIFSALPSWLGSGPNRWSYHIARQLMWQPFRAADARARQEVLGLPPAPFWGPFDSEALRGYPILYAYSPSVIPPPPDWDDLVHVTGYWFLEPAEEWEPPSALVEFLQSGPPPVYVGFGSMSTRNPEATTNLILEALARTQQRGIILSGWSGLRTADLPDSVLMVDSVPFSWLFPRVAAVVHHGGAGTTAAGLRAGVPSIVIPFFGDQPFWARRVRELGAGPAPVPRRRLTVDRLAAAIREAVTDREMRRHAAELGSRIRAEDGVARAVAIIEQSRGIQGGVI
jgi:UDP:flavonoid glycosyltransferase YjiC (YdhE family)